MALDPRRERGDNPTIIGRLTTETKHALKTTELYAYLLAVAGVLIASAIIGEDDEGGNGGGDIFTGDEAWRYVTFLTIGYMVSRGLAKAGSRDPYWATTDDLPGDRGRND